MKDEFKTKLELKKKPLANKSNTPPHEKVLEPAAQGSSSSSSSDHTDRDGVPWGSTQNRVTARTTKNFHDSVVHMAVMQNDHQRLKDLLKNGISTLVKSVDGATAMHRAAEVGSIISAEILISYEANINAMNYAG